MLIPPLLEPALQDPNHTGTKLTQRTALMQIVPYDIKTAQFVTESVSDFPALFLSHCEHGLIHTYSLAYLFSASHSCLLPSPRELTQS